MTKGDLDVSADVSRVRFAEWLEKQLESGLTQQEIAIRARIPAQYLSDVKARRRTVSELFARRLEQEFGVNHVWLLGMADEAESESSYGSSSETPIEDSLPVFPHPIEGDPFAQTTWDGLQMEITGAAAAQARLANRPYILRFGADDRRHRIHKGDFLLISQSVRADAEIQVLRELKKCFLARRSPTDGWEPLARRPGQPKSPTVIGHGVGIVWGPL